MTLFPAAALAALALAGAAPGQAPAPAAPSSATARSSDVANPRVLVAATYDVISGPAGVRDWARFRSLFLPGARMTVTGVRPNGTATLRTLSVDDYVERSGAAFEKAAFFERGVRDHVDQWAHTAVVRSLYESRRAKADPAPFARGINTFVLANDGTRWWIASLSWEAESPASPIPATELLSQPPQP